MIYGDIQNYYKLNQITNIFGQYLYIKCQIILLGT